MITFQPSDPYCITLVTTFRCNAACRNCCFGCRPNFGRTMTLAQMKRYVDICLDAYPQSIKRLALTGGECFLLGNDLDEIVRYGTERGLSVDFISNGYWGTTLKYATERINRLKEYGLQAVTFSVGEDHQHLLKLRNCRNAIVACARAGYTVSVRVESKFGRMKFFDNFKDDKVFMRLVDSKKIDISSWEWQNYNNETITRTTRLWRIRPYGKSSPCKLLFKEINLSPYGDVMACCGIGNMRNPYMRLGNIENEPIKDIYERSFQDALKIWVYEKGATAILQYVHDNSDIRFRHSGNDGCKSCIEIFENPKILPFLRERYDDWLSEIRFTTTHL